MVVAQPRRQASQVHAARPRRDACDPARFTRIALGATEAAGLEAPIAGWAPASRSHRSIAAKDSFSGFGEIDVADGRFSIMGGSCTRIVASPDQGLVNDVPCSRRGGRR